MTTMYDSSSIFKFKYANLKFNITRIFFKIDWSLENFVIVSRLVSENRERSKKIISPSCRPRLCDTKFFFFGCLTFFTLFKPFSFVFNLQHYRLAYLLFYVFAHYRCITKLLHKWCSLTDRTDNKCDNRKRSEISSVWSCFGVIDNATVANGKAFRWWRYGICW